MGTVSILPYRSRTPVVCNEADLRRSSPVEALSLPVAFLVTHVNASSVSQLAIVGARNTHGQIGRLANKQ